jgi:DNA-binding transcriptional MerR regulator
MKISELARLSGLSASAIRFYEAKGLLAGAKRLANGYRDYPEQTVLVLRLIVGAQQTGFTLGEIQQVLPPDLSDWRRSELLRMLLKKVADVELMQKQLASNKRALRGLIRLVENKPEALSCAENAARAAKSLRGRD